MHTQGVRGEILPVSCGSAAIGTLTAPNEALLRVHAHGMRTHCTDQRVSCGGAPIGAGMGPGRQFQAVADNAP